MIIFAFGISWEDSKKALRSLALGLLAATLLVPSSASVGAAESVGRLIQIIVQEHAGAGDRPERLVEGGGGQVTRQLGIIEGFAATVPEASLEILRRSSFVRAVTVDGKVRPLHAIDGYDPTEDTSSMWSTLKSIKAKDLFKQGLTGMGVDVALIDTGVAPVNGMTVAGKVINGADLSFDSQADNLRYLDGYGHGTHMAGIIAGKDDGATWSDGNHDDFFGVAPDARVVNVKVGNAVGVADVSQVIAAIDWVVQHRNDNGMNVRVLNLSFGTDSTQDYRVDPLSYAAEVAWHKGIVVVTAAGNGNFGDERLNNPAYNPYLIAVGANDTKGTYDVSDDVIPDWSSRGDGVRNPDLVAPGKSIQSLRVKGSHIDLVHSEGRINDRFFRGSGTSQSAAAVSGAAALLIQQRPSITPDQLKALLKQTATPLPAADAQAQGSGMLDLKTAAKTATPDAVQDWERSTGTGSLEEARGSLHVVSPDGVELRGEQDIFGNAWDGSSWSGSSWSGSSWSGGEWNGSSWSGSSWSGSSWSGSSWSGSSWSGSSWSGSSWSGSSWSGNSWSGSSWSGSSWSGSSWSGSSWSGSSWSGSSWSGSSWS